MHDIESRIADADEAIRANDFDRLVTFYTADAAIGNAQ